MAHKLHLNGTDETGSFACGGNVQQFGQSAGEEKFLETPAEKRCARCTKALNARNKAYLTSAEARAMGFPTVDEQIERFNKAVRLSRAAALYQDADKRDADLFLSLRKIELMAQKLFGTNGYHASVRHDINAAQGAS